jgi:hypothetical protein
MTWDNSADRRLVRLGDGETWMLIMISWAGSPQWAEQPTSAAFG